MEANSLAQLATGAASGYATDLMAAPDASVMAVIGGGFQAETQVDAVRAVRDIREVRVWSRTAVRRESFAEKKNARAVETVREAISGAHVVTTATFAKDPVLESDWVTPGTHINPVGSHVADRQELPGDLLRAAATVAVDSIEQARIEAGDLILSHSWGNGVELKKVGERPDPARIPLFQTIRLWGWGCSVGAVA